MNAVRGNDPHRRTFHPHERRLGMRRYTTTGIPDLSPIYRCPQHAMPGSAMAKRREASVPWPFLPSFILDYPPFVRLGASPSNHYGITCEHLLIPGFPPTTIITA